MNLKYFSKLRQKDVPASSSDLFRVDYTGSHGKGAPTSLSASSFLVDRRRPMDFRLKVDPITLNFLTQELIAHSLGQWIRTWNPKSAWNKHLTYTFLKKKTRVIVHVKRFVGIEFPMAYVLFLLNSKLPAYNCVFRSDQLCGPIVAYRSQINIEK